MNRRDLMKASAARAAVALIPAIGYRATHAGAPASAVYIDASAIGTGHSGTFADPYSTADALTYFATLSGNINSFIRFATDTTFIGKVTIDGYNYIIEPYGSGEKPLISNHVDISSLTWQADDGAAGTAHADCCYIPVSGGTSAWTAGNTAVTIHDGSAYRQCEPRNSHADLVGALYQCNETAYPSGYPFLQWWDTTTSPNRMWVRRPSGMTLADLNAATVIRPNADDTTGLYSMILSAVADVSVADIDIQCGSGINFYAALLGGLTLNGVDSYNCGGGAGSGWNGFGVTGTSKAARGTDLTMTACRTWRARNNGLEISWLDGVDVDLEVKDAIGNAVEFWESNSNVLIRRLKARQAASMITFWDGTEGAASLHDHIRIQNYECVQRASYLKHGTGGGDDAGGLGIRFSPFETNRKIVSDVHVYNGSMDLDGSPAFYSHIASDVGLGDNRVTIKNNVIRQSQLTNALNPALHVGPIDATADDWVLDRNIWQFGTTRRWQIGNDSTYYSLAAYIAGWDALGPTNETNSLSPAATVPVFMAPAGTLQSTNLALMSEIVPAVGLADSGDAYTPTTDILGVTRSSPDAGAYEYVVGSDSTPAPVDFADQTDVGTNQDITSAAITITGLTMGATISVANGSYEIDASGSFVTSTGTIYNGQTLKARVHSSSSNSTPATVTVTVGGTDITFTATTGAGVTGPAQFTFTDIFPADVFTTYTSLPVLLTGLTGTAAISVAGDASALYSVNSTTVFTASPGTTVNGDAIRARVTTGGDGATPYDAVVTINGVMDTYRVTTDV